MPKILRVSIMKPNIIIANGQSHSQKPMLFKKNSANHSGNWAIHAAIYE